MTQMQFRRVAVLTLAIASGLAATLPTMAQGAAPGLPWAVAAPSAVAVVADGAWATVPIPRVKPEAPASPWIARDQADKLRAVFEALGERQHDAAQLFANDLDDPLARTIAAWARLHASVPGLALVDYGRFLDSHPHWPNPQTLQRQAEKLIDDQTPADQLLAFYDKREPLTGFAKLHLGRALITLGRKDVGIRYIRDAWVAHNFNKGDSRDIVKRYGRHLRDEDHFAKADRALFNRTTAGTEDVEGLLSNARQRQVNVRRSLLRGRASGRSGFNHLPQDEQRDPGVLHAMVRYLRRQEREDEAISLAALAASSPAPLRDPEAWYYERRLLARWALKHGRFEDAYTLTAYSGLTEGSQFAEAEFMAGWIALRFLNEPERAAAHFDFMTSKVSSPISLARGHYWLARAWEAADDTKRARGHHLVAAEYPYTYYGQLSAETLADGSIYHRFPQAPEASDTDKERLYEHDLARAMQMLDVVNEDSHFRRFGYALDDQLTSEGEVRAYAELVRDAGHFDLIVRGGKAARANGASVPYVIYPLYPISGQATAFAEAPFILGLSRQESEFRVDAYSGARAKGMMQLLDGTAKITARKERIPYRPGRLLTDPDYNMTLGAAHLSHLLDRFGGSYVMVLAAYNAGPHRVDQWIEAYGDPRDPDVDPVDWVELIPFTETRNYVMRVLENMQVYRARLNGLPLGMQLAEDLTRGSGAGFDAIGQPVPVPHLFALASRAGPPIVSRDERGGPPLAVLRAQSVAENEVRFTPLLSSPNDPQASASNR